MAVDQLLYDLKEDLETFINDDLPAEPEILKIWLEYVMMVINPLELDERAKSQ